MDDVIAHYRLLERLQEDEATQLYVAEDSRQPGRLLLSIMRAVPGLPLPAAEHLSAVAARLRDLGHPSLLQVHEVAALDGELLMAVEHVDALPLPGLRARRPLPPAAGVALVAQVCEVLASAAQAGLFLAVLRPVDGLASADEQVRMLPLGFAWEPRAAQAAGQRLPTALRYLAPEQLVGQPADARSEVWAVAALLRDMAGRAPSDEGLPEQLRPVLARALHDDPEQRYEDVSALRAALLASPVHPTEPQQDEVFTGIQSLLRQRQDIDRRIAEGFTRNITVMFCDVVASTAYFEQRGDLEGRVMVQRFVGLTSPAIERFGGRIIKTMGDGVLASFAEARDAVESAVAIQTALARDNESRLDEDRIAVRIAMHFGKAVVDATDVFGDVVNVTSRLEHLAHGGSILISAPLREQLAGNPEIVTRFAAHAQLRGRSQPMPCYLVVWRDGEGHEDPTDGQPAPAPASGAPGQDPAQPATGGARIVAPYRMRSAPERAARPADPARNPYMNRVKIAHAEDFFGRKTELARIVSRISASRPQSVSLVGERRIGKSSLLNYIFSPQTRKAMLDEPDGYVFTFVDLQERRGIDIPEFFRSIYESLRREMGESIALGVEPNYEGFKKVVQTLEEQSLKLILIFDEFESITKNERFTAEFYSYARSIANNFNVAYLVSSGRDLQTLCHSKEISDSPYYNIFSNVTLTQFSAEEVEELVVRPAERQGVSLRPFVPFVTDIAGCYPFFVQMACAALFDLLQRHAPDAPQLTVEVKEAFLDEARVHFQQIWDICDEDRREVLLRLAAGQRVHPSKDFVVKRLMREGYVKLQAGAPRVFSSVFAEHLLTVHGPAYRIRRRRRLWFIPW